MNKPYIFLTGIILIALSKCALAQKGPMKRAHDHYDALQYHKAIELYSKEASKNRETAQMWKELGDAYYFRAQYQKAAPWYLKLYLQDKNFDMETQYRYAQVLKATNNASYGNALLKEYYQTVAGITLDAVYTPKRFLGQDSTHTVSKANIQIGGFAYPSNYLDEKTLLITATGKEEHIKNRDGWTGESFSDLYQIRLDEDGNPKGRPEKIKGTINTYYNEGSAVVTKDGNILYFTRNNYNRGKLKRDAQKVSNLKLFRAQLSKNGKWKQVEELPLNDDSFSNGHPALSQDEKTLYFVSDRPGGKGKSDIYQVAIEGNRFGEVLPLPDGINTAAREEFPFVAPDGMLYFASDRIESIGGLDIFVAAPETGTVSTPYREVWHLGPSVNSKKDDFAYTVNSNGNEGFFATNRSSDERDEVFAFVREEPLLRQTKHLITGRIYDAAAQTPLANAKVLFTETATKKTVEIHTDEKGRYSLSVTNALSGSLRITKSNYLSQELVQILDESNTTLEQDFYLRPDRQLFKDGMDIGGLVNPVYFDFDSSEIRPDAAEVLDEVAKLMIDFPNLEIEVRAHTDSRASAAYNLGLSDKRANATISYLFEKGVPKKRISGKGYGESQLVNDCGYDANCSEEEHALNRRSEFIVVKDGATPSEDESDTSQAKSYFTVQLGAFRTKPNLVSFNSVTETHLKKDADGYTRLFAGKFSSREDAEKLARQLKSKGYNHMLIKQVM